MMNLYTHGGSHEKVEELFSKMNQKTVVAYNILIKSCGLQDKADKAMALLHSMMERTSHIRPDLVTFNSVLNALADSSRTDAVENSLEVLRLMDENPNRYLRPDVYSFCAVLKCLANHPCEKTTRRVQDLFDDMYSRHRAAHPNVKPNVVCFTLAIKACLQSGNLDDALMFLDQMETSEVQPNIYTYNEILHYWSSRNNKMAAERAELFLKRLRKRASSQRDPSSADDRASLALDSYAYTLVMIAWLNSGTPEASERAWLIYEWMKADNVIPKIFTFVTLIPYYACSNQPDLMLKADALLGDMEVIDSDDVRPDNRFYSLVLKGWIAIGDSKRALGVANRLIDAYIEGGCQGIEPDPQNFDLVVDALLHSKDISLATRFVDAVQDWKKKGVLPNGISIPTLAQLVDSWRLSTNPEKDVQIATLESYMESEYESMSDNVSHS
jgi:pentatricopeptide repeat protein